MEFSAPAHHPSILPSCPACTSILTALPRGRPKGFTKPWVEEIFRHLLGILGRVTRGFRRKNMRCWSQSQLDSSLGSFIYSLRSL